MIAVALLRPTASQRVLMDLGGRQARAVLELFGDNGGTVCAGRPAAPREGLHQTSGDVLNLFRCLREYPTEIHRRLVHTAVAHPEFVAAQQMLEGRLPVDLGCDPQRAWAFVVDNLGRDARGHFSAAALRRIPTAADALPALVERLRCVELYDDYQSPLSSFDVDGAVVTVDRPERYLSADELLELSRRVGAVKRADVILLTAAECFGEMPVNRTLGEGMFLRSTGALQETMAL